MQDTTQRMTPARPPGYSLVEMLVAAAILAIMIVSIVAVIRKGRELEIVDNHRRMARAVIHAALEGEYDWKQFAAIHDTTISYTDTLDPRSGNPLIDTVTIVVDSVWQTVSSTPVFMKKVTMKVKWVEPDTVADSVVLSKWYANAYSSL
jgi:type II secretory pathway pseudopilin PulG